MNYSKWGNPRQAKYQYKIKLLELVSDLPVWIKSIVILIIIIMPLLLAFFANNGISNAIELIINSWPKLTGINQTVNDGYIETQTQPNIYQGAVVKHDDKSR